MRRLSAATLAGGLAFSCVHPPGVPLPGGVPGARPGLRQQGLRALDDPTVRGGRVLPESVQAARVWGVEPGGGARVIVAGVRLLAGAEGTLVAATDRLPATPARVIPLPDRLGGGFLFPIGTRIWRAASWLGTAAPIFAAPWPIADAMVGVDRVYARSPQGVVAALDPSTGARLDLGPLPPAPHIGKLAALDAWRAIAIADWRGALVTSDAGSSWRPVAIPIEPREVLALDEAFAVGGPDRDRQTQWWAVRADGQAAWEIPAPSTSRPVEDPAIGSGPRPLVAAIEDGWPLMDGTALVARDGALSRVRLSDGAVVETVVDAFPLNPARCHPVSLAWPGDRGAFAFVCGEPQGQTVVYRWEPAGSHLVEVRRFGDPREVLAFGNGALAARGPCATDQIPETGQVWCVMPPGGGWSELRLRVDHASEARLVVLADGRAALVRPPRDGELATAEVAIVSGARMTETPLVIPPLGVDTTRALARGTWMDGFEERSPGILSGWVDAAGSVVGVEISLDGETRVGEYIRDAGAPVVSGRWAFGWMASRRGFETTDGGMTWNKEIDLPDVISPPGGVRERACGPVGCLAAGWVRIGWAAPPSVPPPEPKPSRSEGGGPVPALRLDCEPMTSRPPEIGGERSARAATASTVPIFARRARGGPTDPVWGTVLEFPAFSGHAGPTMPPDSFGVTVEASSGLERSLRPVPLGRVYAWGPNTGDWDPLGRWQVRWQWPWGGWMDARASSIATAPWPTLDAARRELGVGVGATTAWTIAASDDPDHALLVRRHTLGIPSADILALQTGRAPQPIVRPGGEPFPDVESALRIGGRWYLATFQEPSELAATVVWAIDGTVARELARVPRAGLESRAALRLARRSDGRALGLVAEGQPGSSRGPRLWVIAVDSDTGTVGDPESLAPADLSDRTVSLCTGTDAGWEIDLPYPGTVAIQTGVDWGADLQVAMARMRFGRDRACVEGVLGSADGYASKAPQGLTRGERSKTAPIGAARSIEVSVLSARVRFPLRCWLR